MGSAFFALMFGAVDLGRYMYALQSLRTTTAEATRAVLMDDTLLGCGPPPQVVARRAPFLDGARTQLCVVRAATNGKKKITLTVTYPFQFAVPLFGKSAMTLTETTNITH